MSTKPTYEQLMAAITLAAHDELFFSFYNEDIKQHDDIPRPVILCNDCFQYASADGESIEWEFIPELLKLYEGEGWPCIVEWVAKKRGKEPLGRVKEGMERYKGEQGNV